MCIIRQFFQPQKLGKYGITGNIRTGIFRVGRFFNLGNPENPVNRGSDSQMNSDKEILSEEDTIVA